MRIDLSGHLVVDIDDNRVLLIAPRFRDGRHVTFYLRPRPSGRYAGLLTPHTTIGKVHRILARFRPERVRMVTERIGEDLAASYRARTREVEAAELAEEGWAIIFPLDDEERRELFGSLWSEHGSRIEFRVDEDVIARVGEALLERAVSPLVLDEPDFPRDEQVWAIRVNDFGEPEICVIMFRSDGQTGCARWYSTPVPFVSPLSLERQVDKYCGRAGLKALKIVDRFFNGPPRRRATAADTT